MVKYDYAGGQRAAMRRMGTPGAGVVYYLHGDHLGSTSLTTCGSSSCVLPDIPTPPPDIPPPPPGIPPPGIPTPTPSLLSQSGSNNPALGGSVGLGGEVARQLYYPYGAVRWSSGALPTDYTFTGQRNESSLGLMDYNARYYDP